MVVGITEETGPSACQPFSKSRVGGVRFVSDKGAEGFKTVVAKDAKPMGDLGGINPQEMSSVFEGVASSNSQDGGETLIDTPVKRSLAAPFHFLALLSR
jgi:hypothetical protein